MSPPDVVTGAAGFLGSVLAETLLARGRRVRALVRRRGAAPPGTEEVVADLRDPSSLRAALDGAERVFHCAGKISLASAPDPALHEVNVLGAQNLAAALPAHARLVHVSSVKTFSIRDGVISEQNPRYRDGPDAYARSKLSGEEILRNRAVIVNPTGIIGPGDAAPSPMGETLARLATGQMPVFVDGAFDWVDVRDVVEGILAAAERGTIGENYILGGHFASVRTLAALVSAAGGAPEPRWSLPRWLVWGVAPLAERSDVRAGREPRLTRPALAHLWSDARAVRSDRAKSEIGYAPRPLEETIADTVRWFLARRP